MFSKIYRQAPDFRRKKNPSNHPTLFAQKEKVFAQSGVAGFRQCLFEVRKYCPKALSSSKNYTKVHTKTAFYGALGD
jgi:hypothetical protein